MWQCNKHLYNVNIPENKIIMRKGTYSFKQLLWEQTKNPREQLKQCIWNVKSVLRVSKERALYNTVWSRWWNVLYPRTT